jgi:hypothetical protein
MALAGDAPVYQSIFGRANGDPRQRARPWHRALLAKASFSRPDMAGDAEMPQTAVH